MITWSYSSIKTFAQCPKKYYHLKVAKDVQDQANQAALYGEEAHKAAEEYIKVNKPIPQKFLYLEDILETLKQIPGTKLCEEKLGIRRRETASGLIYHEPCKFFDKDVWWRGIADLIIISGTTAYCIDYKTGKNARYADTKQLDLLAAAIFLHYPEVTKVKSALLFVVSQDFIQKEHKAEELETYLSVFDNDLGRLGVAHTSGVWNPISGPLCGWCPVTTCAHNTKKDRSNYHG